MMTTPPTSFLKERSCVFLWWSYLTEKSGTLGAFFWLLLPSILIRTYRAPGEKLWGFWDLSHIIIPSSLLHHGTAAAVNERKGCRQKAISVMRVSSPYRRWEVWRRERGGVKGCNVCAIVAGSSRKPRWRTYVYDIAGRQWPASSVPEGGSKIVRLDTPWWAPIDNKKCLEQSFPPLAFFFFLLAWKKIPFH